MYIHVYKVEKKIFSEKLEEKKENKLKKKLFSCEVRK